MTPQYDLLGEYSVTLDSKGRFRLPGNVLKDLGDRDTLKFVINRGFTNCLTLYPMSVWEEEKKPVDALNKFNRKNMQFIRLFYRGATEVVPDSADRILLPKGLQEVLGKNLEEGAKLKNLKLSCLTDRIEIWDETEYERMLDVDMENYDELAEERLGDSPSDPLLV